MIGLDKPAMSITGSGAHGIIATLPLYAVAKVNGLPDEKLLRGHRTQLSGLHVHQGVPGKLSAFCGCGIAAGSGTACGLVYLKGGTVDMMAKTINNMASSLTGMICDGGNKGCTMKGIAAVDCAFQSVDFAMQGIHRQRARHQRHDTGGHHAQHGSYRLPGYGGDGEGIVETESKWNTVILFIQKRSEVYAQVVSECRQSRYFVKFMALP